MLLYDIDAYWVKMEGSYGIFNNKRDGKKWDISRRRVTLLCSQGRIDGASLRGNTWLIPENAAKPEDLRRVRKNGQ